jgi:hypothetical protein
MPAWDTQASYIFELETQGEISWDGLGKYVLFMMVVVEM